jgi:23S rRNA pseudouridine1911/1915/1917 synthase
LNVVLDTEVRAEPEDIPLDVLYEDEHVRDQQAGRAGGPPRRRQSSGTLVNALLFRDPSLAVLPRAGIVHRLDKDTSGVMVVARTLQAQTALVEQLSARDVHRQYLAIVMGALVAGGTVDAPIDRHPRDRLKMAVREDGKEAVTHYRLRERFRAHRAGVPPRNRPHPPDPRAHGASQARHRRRSAVRRAVALPKGATDSWPLRCAASSARRCMPKRWNSPTRSPASRCATAPVPADMLACWLRCARTAANSPSGERR